MTFKISMAALTVAASALLAQNPTKVGVINIQQAIVSTKDGQKAAQDLQARFEPKSKEIEKRAADLQTLQQQYQKSSNTASEDQRNRMAREIDQKQKALQRDNEDARAEIEQEQQKIINELGGRIMQVIDKYARDNAYTLILDVSSPQTPVLYMATGIDVTADIVKLYDANAPAAPPAAPATKPAAMPTSAPKPPAAPKAKP